MEKVSNPISKAHAFMSEPPYTQPSQTYLVGLRGFMVIQSFLWVFLQVFVPVAVKDSPNDEGPLYQKMLRKTISVLFWNETLIYSTMILLSARMICLPFLTNPTRNVLASSLFRRGLRLWFPTALSVGIAVACFKAFGVDYIDQFYKASSPANISAPLPVIPPNTLAYWNGVFEIFWVNKAFYNQAGNFFFPSATLWMITVVFMQAYTVYLCMIIVPYTRPTWRVVGGSLMILTAWWVQSWAWYSVTGLLLADAVLNMDLAGKTRNGFPVGRWVMGFFGNKKYDHIHLPSWVVYGCLVVAGLFMQYFYTAWRPDLLQAEVVIHAGEYYTGGLNTAQTPGTKAARDDNYVFLVGFFLFLETTNWMQMVFKNPVFVYLGKRSLSYFLVQSTIIYVAGIKMYMYIQHSITNDDGSMSIPYSGGAVTAVFIVCALATVVFAEIYYHLIDVPSQKFARWFWVWICAP